MTRTGSRGAIGAWVLLAFLVIDSYAMYSFFTRPYPGANDFYARWRPTRAWLFEGRGPYDDSVTLDTQIGMYGRPALPSEDKALFSYPFFSIVFFALPALVADYAWASAIWLAVLQMALLALLALSFRWARWQPPPWLFGVTLLFGWFWYHTARTLILGQFAALNAVLMVGALMAARSRREVLAGVLLGLSACKPQMTFLFIPGLLLWAASLRRWKLAAWGVGTLAVLLGGSLLLRPTWIGEWQHQLSVYVDNSVNRPPVTFMAETLFPSNGPLAQAILSGLLLACLLWAWWLARGRAAQLWEWTAALTLVMTSLVAPRTATTDYMMMTPVLFMLFGFMQARWGRRGIALITLTQVALLVGLWALFFATVQGDQEHSAMYLPLPLLLFAGLLFIRPSGSAASEGAAA